VAFATVAPWTIRNYAVHGDIVIEIDGQKIENNEDLVSYLDQNARIGEKVGLLFMRGKKEYGTTVVLQELK